MELTFGFGKGGLDLRLPAGPEYRIVRAHAAAALPDIRQAIAEALERPVAGPSLAALARGKHSAAISVCDITRPAPNPLTLPPILKILEEAGIRPENITLCIAAGLHRAATPAELDTILSPAIAARYPIHNHDAKDRDGQQYLGSTQRGTPVWIAKRFLQAELHITLGFIEQHLMLGFSGGRKLIAPGVAGQDTIKTIHSPRFMREALATEGSYEDNPLHAELLEIARMARHDFMLDVTLTRAREISGIFAGEPVAAHAAGVASLRSTSLELLDAPVDAAITGAAGYPLDLTFYQTIKGITAVQHVVKPGGRILVVSECSEGSGSPEFTEMLAGYTGGQSFLDAIAETPVVADQWQLEKLALVDRRYELLFYTPGVPKAGLGALGATSFPSAETAIDALMNGLPPGASVGLFPDGPYAFARVGER